MRSVSNPEERLKAFGELSRFAPGNSRNECSVDCADAAISRIPVAFRGGYKE